MAASFLTATSLRSSYYYLLFLLMIVSTVVYLLFFREPDIRSNLERQAFYYNYSTFKDAIYLANLRFLANTRNRRLIDNWVEKDPAQEKSVGLDFNRFGYPIGTDITDSQQNTPETVANCIQIWQFLMGPVQPEIAQVRGDKNYWASLTHKGLCVYHSEKVDNVHIIYDSTNGKVVFSNISG